MPFERTRRRWNIKDDFKETERKGVDWIHLVQGKDQRWALANTVINLRIA